jgi:hypothetical protein
MTTKISLGFAAFIALFFVLDHYLLHMNTGLFLGKKMIELINFLAIWR